MRRFVTAALLSLAVAPAGAAGDLSRQEPITVTVQLGTTSGEHRFVPPLLKFDTGRLYRLRLENPSPNDYYFHSAGLADAVYTRKVSVLDADEKTIAEVYGGIRRLEVKAGGLAEWWFVPVRTGRFDDLASTRSHTQAGMTGTVEIE